MLDFIIVGAAKAGTESLVFHMNNHMEISLPKKEINFFNNAKEYPKGFKYYENRVASMCKQKRLFGEKSPSYCFHPNVAEKIYEYNPKMKLIWILRHPVKRTYSNYWHLYKKGIETLDFNTAIKKENERIKKVLDFGYVKRSTYVEQVEEFLKFFEINQMSFLLFEEFVKDPIKELSRVFDLLGVDTESFKYLDEVKNKTTMPLFPKLNQFIGKTFGYYSIINRGIVKVNKIVKPSGYPKMDPQTYNELLEHFKPLNNRLQELIHRDLSVWNK